jgi:SAM-dependent methyltransferase
VPNGKALDIGCGNGKFIQAMNSLGWQFEGVEFNPVAVDACREAGLKVFNGDLQAAGYRGNSFDLITARHVIEHVPDPNNFMREITRILKKGGRLVIETPNSQALGRRWFGTKWYANEVPRHMVLFNPDNLNMLAERHGLRKIRVKTSTTPKIILNSLDYLIGRQDNPSRKSKVLRILSRPYVMLATLTGRGDIVLASYEKP